jgi:carboxyl-terminal processing protease
VLKGHGSELFASRLCLIFFGKVMTNRKRDFLTIALVVGLTLISFAAGFLVNELVQLPVTFGRESENAEFGVFWEAWSWVEENYIGEIPANQQMTHGAVRGAIEVLGDPYTIFVEPVARSQERDRFRGNFGGIGATVEQNEAGEIILRPIPDNPAEAAGILDGDVLIAVDGETILPEMTVEDTVLLIRGEEGKEVILTVVHPGESTPVDIAIIRQIILLPSVSYRVLEEDPTIGYIRLGRFSGESAGEIEDAILDLESQSVEKLILDLRQNPGGLLNAAVEVSDHFLDEGPVVYQISKTDKEKIFEASNDTIAADLPLVVLTDGATASAAEIVAGALQDRERATLIGLQTFGKGSVQLVHDLSDGSSIRVTSARWLTPDRHQIDQQGLEPDVAVELTEEALSNGLDEVLQAAVQYFDDMTIGQN